MAWHCPQTFNPQKAFLCMFSVSFVPKEGEQQSLNPFLTQGFAPLCPCLDYYLDYCHDCYFKVFTRDKPWLFTPFLLLFSFQRANRRPIVYALTRVQLSLVSGNANSCEYPAKVHFFMPREMQTGGQLLVSNLDPSYLLCHYGPIYDILDEAKLHR